MIYFRSELSVAFPFISTKNVVLPIVYNIYILYILFAINLDTFVNILKNICLLKIIFHYFKILVLRYKKKPKSFSYTLIVLFYFFTHCNDYLLISGLLEKLFPATFRDKEDIITGSVSRDKSLLFDLCIALVFDPSLCT